MQCNFATTDPGGVGVTAVKPGTRVGGSGVQSLY